MRVTATELKSRPGQYLDAAETDPVIVEKSGRVKSVESNNLGDDDELIITVRGKESYVVMNMEHYNYLRECELEAALHSVSINISYRITLELLISDKDIILVDNAPPPP